MRALIRSFVTVVTLSLCLPLAADEIESSHPEWDALMKEAKRLWAVGDFEAGNGNLLLAVELALDSAEPLTLARSLDMAARAVSDSKEQMRLLLQAYEIKESARGPRYVGLADTLILMGGTASTLAYKRREDGSDPDPSTYVPAAQKLYSQARAILLEEYGEGCEVGRAEGLLAGCLESLGDVGKAEKLYRKILDYCPVDPADADWEQAGTSAAVMLAELLRKQGREAEVAELPELPSGPGRDYGEPSPGYEAPSDVFLMPTDG